MVDSGILIYGINKQAASLHKMISVEGQGEVVAFAVDKKYRKSDNYCGLPVINFEDVMDSTYPTRDYSIALSFGYKNMVKNRELKFFECKDKGYSIFSFISRYANVYSDEIGEGCNILPGVTIAPYTKIGKGTFIESGCVISHHCKIGEFNFIAPGAHLCGAIKTGKNCFIGGASEIVNDCVLGNYVYISALAKVNKDQKDYSTVQSPFQEKSVANSFQTMEKMFRKVNQSG